jgi:hypothetical protein
MSAVIDVFPIIQAIHGELYVDVQISCSACDGWGIIRLRDSDWQSMRKRESIGDFRCRKCRSAVLS